ncbi:biotin--[acetyl-CoA-carboxylase] ligase [Fangia hongkongensis]|uniref:biotin--[acetyl-CoA-carboxylase] ligase n=1 Tax=Fangia hongkongensis TaxID=270495 RepID=UPI000381FDF6|nr:biotin--[acetyl-CoA-carboxylase] ligase [Fangia hongkongensis]MBK2125503.1 biotin--[acetyl-CoA-carboxylase] ligase [Fangia hongkongensis]
MNNTLINIFKLLSADRYIDGSSIGQTLNITRSAVWKAIQQLQDKYQVPIISSKGKGYKLADNLKLIDLQAIYDCCHNKETLIEYFPSIDSTNTYLQKSVQRAKYHICISDHQSQGKGRFNRPWSSPFAQNIYFSLKTTLNKDVSELSGLSLAIACAISDALVKSGCTISPQIKWPNDIYLNGKKLSGNLIEVKAESNYQSQIIIGIGINANMKASTNISQEWTSLALSTGQIVNREAIIISLISTLLESLNQFENEGFNAFLAQYQQYDYLHNKEISIILPNETDIQGQCLGVNALGQLLIKSENTIKTFASGEAYIDKSSL